MHGLRILRSLPHDPRDEPTHGSAVCNPLCNRGLRLRSPRSLGSQPAVSTLPAVMKTPARTRISLCMSPAGRACARGSRASPADLPERNCSLSPKTRRRREPPVRPPSTRPLTQSAYARWSGLVLWSCAEGGSCDEGVMQSAESWFCEIQPLRYESGIRWYRCSQARRCSQWLRKESNLTPTS